MQPNGISGELNARSAAGEYAPYASSLPSSFQKAKPRVYRSAYTPDQSRTRQTKCNVITTSGADNEPDSIDAIPHDEVPTTRATGTTRRPRVGPDKTAIVSLEEMDDGTTFMLDFRPGSRPRKTAKSSLRRSNDTAATKDKEWDVLYMSWEGMSERQRRVELMAATKSRIIRQLAESESIEIPGLHEFEPSEHSKPDLVASAFSRWFLASRMHRQRIREQFLAEELEFAAKNMFVHQQLAGHGRTPPTIESIGSSASAIWREYVVWYSLGRSSVIQSHAGEQLLLRERLEERADFLEHRLKITADVEEELQKRTREAAAQCDCQPVPLVFVFEDFLAVSTSDDDDPTSWINISQANRQKELALALLDPQVQVAAIRSDVELPDLSSANLEDLDIFSLAGKFLPWWKSSGNEVRKEFLDREATEASTDSAILDMLRSQQQQAEDAGVTNFTATLENFVERYFKADKVRFAFLKKKLFFLKRRSRVASVAKYGKLPVPLMFVMLPAPVVHSFSFTPLNIVQGDVIGNDETITSSDAIGEDASISLTVDQTQNQTADGDKTDLVNDEEWQKQLEETERQRRAHELDLMSIEDDLSRSLNANDDDSDEDIDDKMIAKPKRSDFSRSYFFGNLPIHFRFLSATGWGGSGSGVDNGDEEIEEEERLERERERQRLLDQQEAERILEAERQAERLRIEKEREEKALQARRLRQSELKKVLIHQAELNAQRRLDLELQRMEAEQRCMANEEGEQRKHLAQIESDRRGMLLEDAHTQSERRARRTAAALQMRRMLTELTQMTVEDELSRRATSELRRQELEEDAWQKYEADLYSTFRPFFPSSQVPSEDFLPSIQQRLLEQRRLQALQRPSYSPYTVPFSEAVLMEEVEHDPYLARDSRKFQLLMGLPQRRSQQQKRSRIPSEEAIIHLQQAQKHAFPLEDECRDAFTSQQLQPVSLLKYKHMGRKQERRPRHLPELSRGKTAEVMADLNELGLPEGGPRASTTSQNQRAHHNYPERQTPPLLMPFFRGNMLVRGVSQGRARDYSY